MPHRPNPIPRFNNPQYASSSLNVPQNPPLHGQTGNHGGLTPPRRDLTNVPPRHRGHSVTSANPPSIGNQEGSHSNRSERTSGGSHRTLPPPRFQRKQRPPRVQQILAGTDTVDGALSTLAFGPLSNWGLGTQSVASLPMAAVNAASSAGPVVTGVASKSVLNSFPSANISSNDLPVDSTAQQYAPNGFSGATLAPNESNINIAFKATNGLSRKVGADLSSSLRVPSDEKGFATSNLNAPSVLAPYSASAPVTPPYIDPSGKPHITINHTRNSNSGSPPSHSIPQPPLKGVLKHHPSAPKLSDGLQLSPPLYPPPERPLPSLPALPVPTKVKFFDEVEVIPCSPYVGGLDYEQSVIGSEDGVRTLDAGMEQAPQADGLDDWDDIYTAINYATETADEEQTGPHEVSIDRAFANGPPRPNPHVPYSSAPIGPAFAESIALTPTVRGRPVSTLNAHAHRIPVFNRSRTPSPTFSGNGSCESTGSMASLPAVGSYGSFHASGSMLSLHSAYSLGAFSPSASMASLTTRSTVSGKSLRTIDSYGSLRSAGGLLGSSIWAMGEEESFNGVSGSFNGVGQGGMIVGRQEFDPQGTGYGLPKGSAPALEPFNTLEPTPRGKNRPVSGFSSAAFLGVNKKTMTFQPGPTSLTDNPFASLETVRGSPPPSSINDPSPVSTAGHGASLSSTAEPFVPRAQALPQNPPSVTLTKFTRSSTGSFLSSNAKSFVPRSSTVHDAQFSGIPFEATPRASTRVGVRRAEDVFVGGTGITRERV